MKALVKSISFEAALRLMYVGSMVILLIYALS